jgi:Zn-dependent peptidase ImmA (M78 family)
MHESELDIVQEYMGDEPVDPAKILRALGVEYTEEPLPPGESGHIIASDGAFRVVVNSNEGPQRRRFTAAHELAHYLMHRDLLAEAGKMNRHIDCLFGSDACHDKPSPLRSRHEVQANRLAARIIMPASRIRHHFEQGENAAALAQRFGVSPAAMEIRLKTLNLRALENA